MATQSTTTEATAPTGDIKIFIDAFNLYLDSEIKNLTDAQTNLKNIYADAIKISTPRTGTWPKDANILTIGDLFKYTFPDVTTNTFIKPPNSSISDGINVNVDNDKLADFNSWQKDFNSTPEIKEKFDNIKKGLNSNTKLADFNQLKKPGITNPNLYSPGQYYFDVFMFEMLSKHGPLKSPDGSNGGKNGISSNFLKTYGGSASVSNFDPSGEIDMSLHGGSYSTYPIALDYYEFSKILQRGDIGQSRMESITGIDIELANDYLESNVFTVKYKSGVTEELKKDPKFNIKRGKIRSESTPGDLTSSLESPSNFIGDYEHILLYKAFVQAGDNYKSIVLPYRNPEPIAPVVSSTPAPIVVIPTPLESEYIFNVEKIDTFIFVSGTPSIPIEFTIVPNDGTTYIFEETVNNNNYDMGDDDVLSDEYSEGDFQALEETALKLDYTPDASDKQAEVTDPSTLSGPFEIPQPKDGTLTISAAGLKKLKSHEGSRATVYDDATGKSISSWASCKGYPTVGVGHLVKDNEKSAFSRYLSPGKMTDSEIDNLLLKDLQERIKSLNNRLTVKVTQNQFDALLSMMFNTGGGNGSFKKAVALTNQGKKQDAAKQIRSAPTTSKGKVLAGLVRRRGEEADTYIA